MKTITLIVIILTASLQGFTQLKYEKETRVKKSNIPIKAVNFVDSIKFNSKVKWYKEIGLNTISFEAKTKHRGKKYSIEFNEDGLLEDIEIEIKRNEIPNKVLNAISQYLFENHNKYSIDKIQVQLLGETHLFLDFLKGNEPSTGIVTNYEIVISSKINDSYTILEYLFSKDGKYIQNKRITEYRTENIEY